MIEYPIFERYTFLPGEPRRWIVKNSALFCTFNGRDRPVKIVGGERFVVPHLQIFLKRRYAMILQPRAVNEDNSFAETA